MKKINKYIIAISSTVLVGVAITAGVLSSAQTLVTSVPKLNLKLKDGAKKLTPSEFVSNVVFNNVVDRKILESYVSGIPNPDNLEDKSLNDINRNFIIDVQDVWCIPNKDIDFINISIHFQSKYNSFNETVNYKLSGLFYESQHTFDKLIAAPTAFAKNVLSSVVNLSNYKRYIMFNVDENFPNLETTAHFYVKQIDHNENLGSVNLKLIYEHNGFKFPKEMNITGFKTTDINDSEELNKYVSETHTLTNNILVPFTLPTEVNKDNLVDFVTFESSSHLHEVHFEILEFVKLDDEGVLKIKAYFKYHKVSQEKEFVVNGFQTIKQRRKQEFDKFCDSIQLRIKPEASLKYIKASMVNIDNFRAYVDGIIDNPLYQITILEIISNDSIGSINVKLKITSDNATNEKVINQEVFGFYISIN